METLEGTQIANLGLNLKRQGDLLYHEGPLLSHFANTENPNEHYLYKWTDCDESANRWLIFKVFNTAFEPFFNKEMTLLQMISANPFVYFIDLDNNVDEKKVFICSTNKIPSDYLPSENSFFDETQYEQYAFELKAYFQRINGTANEHWFEKIMKEVADIRTNQESQNDLLTKQNILLNSVVSRFQGETTQVLEPMQDFAVNEVLRGPFFLPYTATKTSPIERDDLTLIEGIGPKIQELLNNANIYTFWQLAITKIEDIEAILHNASPIFRTHDPATWTVQAELAANNRFEELANWQKNFYNEH